MDIDTFGNQNLYTSGKGSADQFRVFQKSSNFSLAISVTRKCTFHCSHCITTSNSSEFPKILNDLDAKLWIEQLPELSQAGIKNITFTGGEPTLGIDFVKKVAEVAHRFNINTSIVTNGSWARTAKGTHEVINQLKYISFWDIGFDLFHSKFIDINSIYLIINALFENRAKFIIRFCISSPITDEEINLISKIQKPFKRKVPIVTQLTRKIGRAKILKRESSIEKIQNVLGPCVSSGPFIREDGFVRPCCSGLIYHPDNILPLNQGNIYEDHITKCRRNWINDPILRMIRMAGFWYIYKWMLDEGYEKYVPSVVPESSCEFCVLIWDKDNQVEEFLKKKISCSRILNQLSRMEKGFLNL